MGERVALVGALDGGGLSLGLLVRRVDVRGDRGGIGRVDQDAPVLAETAEHFFGEGVGAGEIAHLFGEHDDLEDAGVALQAGGSIVEFPQVGVADGAFLEGDVEVPEIVDRRLYALGIGRRGVEEPQEDGEQ